MNDPKQLERRKPFLMDKEKFGTQREVTHVILALLTVVTFGVIFVDGSQAERSTILQTIVALSLLAVGYWLGASKAAADAQKEKNPNDVG